MQALLWVRWQLACLCWSSSFAQTGPTKFSSPCSVWHQLTNSQHKQLDRINFNFMKLFSLCWFSVERGSSWQKPPATFGHRCNTASNSCSAWLRPIHDYLLQRITSWISLSGLDKQFYWDFWETWQRIGLREFSSVLFNDVLHACRRCCEYDGNWHVYVGHRRLHKLAQPNSAHLAACDINWLIHNINS